MSCLNSKKLKKTSIEDLFQGLPCHVYLKDKQGIYLMANDLLAQALGFQKGEEILGKTDDDLYEKHYAQEYRANDLKAIQLKAALQVKEAFKSKNDKEERIFLTNKIPFYEGEAIVGTLGMSTDITASEKLKANSEIYLSNLLDNLPGHIYWKDKKGCYLGCNQLQANNLGFDSPKELIGKTDFDMPWREQAELYFMNDQKVIKTGEPVTVEEISTLKDGKVHTFLANKVPLRGDHNEIIGVLGISTDITELKEMQKQLIGSQLREAHFKAMSALGGMIAHELKTPLMSIALSANGIKKFFPILVEAYRKYSEIGTIETIRRGHLNTIERIADNIEVSARYAGSAINIILSGFRYFDASFIPVEAIEINNVIEQALANYPKNKDEQHLITFRPTKTYKVLGKTGIIVYVLHNLLKNALYAIRSAGKGSITISLEKKEEGFVEIHVKDTGKGMPKEVLEHIFEAFYTTKNLATSIGLGLYFCKLSLEKIGGQITCDSELGKYTLFTITLKEAA